MNKVEPRTLKGFMELMPEKQILFNEIKEVVKKNYEKAGFYPLDTPVLEYKEVLLSKAGGETEKQIYQFAKGDTELAMRFDLTVPLAKYVAKNYSDLVFPFKRYQIDKVFRGEKPQKGRFRELYQADIDIIGDGELAIMNDAEIPSIIYNIFKELNIGKFTIRINNRKILNGFYEELDLKSKSTDILRIVDKLEKIGIENVKSELKALDIEENKIEKISNFIDIKGSNEEILTSLNNLGVKNEIFKIGVLELKEVITYIAMYNVPEEYFNIDLTIARGLDYYTGTVYETMIDGKREIGSICSGGRYDNLAENFTDKKLPGVGISIGLTRLFDQLTSLEIFKVKKASLIDALIIPLFNLETDLNLDDKLEAFKKPIEVLNNLKANNIVAEIYKEKKKLKAIMKYADKKQIPYVIIIGEEELKTNTLTLKNMKTGEQKVLKIDDNIKDEMLVINLGY